MYEGLWMVYDPNGIKNRSILKYPYLVQKRNGEFSPEF